jgi:hypothetical protein
MSSWDQILKAESVRTLFIPSNFDVMDGAVWCTAHALTGPGNERKDLHSVRSCPSPSMLDPIYESGWAGTNHFIDPATGIAVIQHTGHPSFTLRR